MEQLKDFADDRLIDGCLYCAGTASTREHVPSRVLLDRPFPENLPIVWACRSCNNKFSGDEEYFACLVESVLSGSTDPESVRRTVVAEILRRSPALRARIQEAMHESDGRLHFSVELERVENILLKLARGHAAYDLSAVRRGAPTGLSWGPLANLSPECREKFESVYVADLLPEVGSRAMQRMIVTQFTLAGLNGSTKSLGMVASNWVDVQEGRYRYLAHHDQSGVRVRMVLDEYLYCDVLWQE